MDDNEQGKERPVEPSTPMARMSQLAAAVCTPIGDRVTRCAPSDFGASSDASADRQATVKQLLAEADLQRQETEKEEISGAAGGSAEPAEEIEEMPNQEADNDAMHDEAPKAPRAAKSKRKDAKGNILDSIHFPLSRVKRILVAGLESGGIVGARATPKATRALAYGAAVFTEYLGELLAESAARDGRKAISIADLNTIVRHYDNLAFLECMYDDFDPNRAPATAADSEQNDIDVEQADDDKEIEVLDNFVDKDVLEIPANEDEPMPIEE